MAFDLEKQDFTKLAEVGYTFNLKLPTGVDSGAKLTIIGDMSKAVKAFQRKKYQEYQQRQATAKRKGREDEINLDEAEDAAIEAALVRLIGWEGIESGGKPVPFSKDKAAEILREHSWIREEILKESADVVNFAAKTSNF
jgi:hypothetical protein